MSIRFIKGIILPTTAVILGLLSFYTAWDAWLSNSVITTGNQAAAIDAKLDLLLQRNGVDPAVINK